MDVSERIWKGIKRQEQPEQPPLKTAPQKVRSNGLQRIVGIDDTLKTD